MQALLELQRKNSLLQVLGDTSCWQAETGAETREQAVDESIDVAGVAETLLVLSRAFGEDALPSRVRDLARAGQRLSDAALLKVSSLASLPPSSAVGRERDPVAKITCETLQAPCRVSIEGLELAQSALEDFVCSYLPLHGLSPEEPGDVLRHMPLLAFVEGHIYDLDQANEDSLMPHGDGGTVNPESLSRAPGDDPFVPLRAILRERGLLTARIEKELVEGARFWALERQLCQALLAGTSAGDGCGNTCSALTVERCHVEEALRLKSFDYRIMNLLLYALRRAEPVEEHMAFLAASEVLVEIGDDLADYAEDVERNSFNVYRCFLAMYDKDKAQAELLNFIRDAEAAYAQGLARLHPDVAASWRRRCERSKRHGVGSERGPDGGAVYALGPRYGRAWCRPSSVCDDGAASDMVPRPLEQVVENGTCQSRWTRRLPDVVHWRSCNPYHQSCD